MSFDSDPSSGRRGSYQNPNPFVGYDDDEYTQVYSLINANIVRARSGFDQVKKLTEALGKDQDGQKMRDQLAAKNKELTTIMMDTKQNIARLSSLSTKGDSSKRKTRKGQVDSLTQDFDKFFALTTQLVQIATKKMEEIPTPSRIPMSGRDESRYAEAGEGNQRLLDESEQRSLIQLDADRDFQDHIIHSRDQDITVIKNQMKEVNEIFKGLATLVDGQGEMVDTIASNITASSANTRTGLEEIKKADESQTSERTKLCWLALIITVIIIIIVVVVVLVIKYKN